GGVKFRNSLFPVVVIFGRNQLLRRFQLRCSHLGYAVRTLSLFRRALLVIGESCFVRRAGLSTFWYRRLDRLRHSGQNCEAGEDRDGKVKRDQSSREPGT